jgi:hypothetical protein
VSILIATVVGDDGLLAAGREDLDDAHAATYGLAGSFQRDKRGRGGREDVTSPARRILT